MKLTPGTTLGGRQLHRYCSFSIFWTVFCGFRSSQILFVPYAKFMFSPWLLNMFNFYAWLRWLNCGLSSVFSETINESCWDVSYEWCVWREGMYRMSCRENRWTLSPVILRMNWQFLISWKVIREHGLTSKHFMIKSLSSPLNSGFSWSALICTWMLCLSISSVVQCSKGNLPCESWYKIIPKAQTSVLHP